MRFLYCALAGVYAAVYFMVVGMAALFADRDHVGVLLMDAGMFGMGVTGLVYYVFQAAGTQYE